MPAATLVLPGLGTSPGSSAVATVPDPVLVWNVHAGEAAIAACLAPVDNPLHESRMYAIMHIAIHDGLNAIDRRSQPYGFDEEGDAGASPAATVAAAAHRMLVQLISELPTELTSGACKAAGVASAEQAFVDELALIPAGAAKTAGIALGERAAAAILGLRAEDGAVGPFLNFACPTADDTEAGEYQCTPGTPFIVFESWENVIPFVLHDSGQFRPGPPYRVTSRKYTADYDEIKALGGDGVITPSARTEDQTEIALY